MTRFTKAQQQSNMPWDFSEVPRLVGRLLAGAFGRHPFNIQRNKSEETISISWELGPTDEEVWDFISKTFPRCDWKSHEYDPPGMIEGRWLHPYCYQTNRYDLSSCDAMNIPRLIAAGADIGERDNRGYIPIEQAVLRGNESAALALLEAGSDYYSLLPGGDLYEAKKIMPALLAAIESREVAAAMRHSESPRVF